MKVIRPIRERDLPELEQMAYTTSGGITTLPDDSALLKTRIQRSLRAFSSQRSMGNETYLFVLEDTETNRAIGCSGLLAQVGIDYPLFLYELESIQLESPTLRKKTEMTRLRLKRIEKGPSEVSTLFLMPQYREQGLGKLLSLSRFLFLALHRERFEATVQASLRGVLDPSGSSPFYDHIARPFFQIEYARANQLRLSNPRFIEEIQPAALLYLPLLSKKIQTICGKTHPNTRAALKLLQREGFSYCHQIDIFDAGPYVSCGVDHIRAVQNSQRIQLGDPQEGSEGRPTCILANPSLESFRACLSPAIFDNNRRLRPPQEVMDALELSPGDEVGHLVLGG